jgi:hypothetical protein
MADQHREPVPGGVGGPLAALFASWPIARWVRA